MVETKSIAASRSWASEACQTSLGASPKCSIHYSQLAPASYKPTTIAHHSFPHLKHLLQAVPNTVIKPPISSREWPWPARVSEIAVCRLRCRWVHRFNRTSSIFPPLFLVSRKPYHGLNAGHGSMRRQLVWPHRHYSRLSWGLRLHGSLRGQHLEHRSCGLLPLSSTFSSAPLVQAVN